MELVRLGRDSSCFPFVESFGHDVAAQAVPQLHHWLFELTRRLASGMV